MKMIESSVNTTLETKVSRSRLLLTATLGLLLLVVLAFRIIPFDPVMPMVGLDPSWVMGMNEAVAQHLRFGTEIIFTYGPYASVVTHAYNPATAGLMFGGAAYLVICYVFVLLVITHRTIRMPQTWIAILLFCFLLLYLSPSGSSLFPLYLGDTRLLLYLPTCLFAVASLQTAKNQNLIHRFRSLALAAIVTSPLGFLPLVKGSLLLACVPVIGLTGFMFAWRRQWWMLATASLSPIATAVVAWLLAGQVIIALPAFFISLIPISSGYTDAMSLVGDIFPPALYVVGATVLLISLTVSGLTSAQKIIVALGFFLVLFLTFKEGFVRQDGHVIIAAVALAVFAALIIVAADHSMKWLYGIVAIACAFVLLAPHVALGQLLASTKHLLRNSINGAIAYQKDPKIWENQYAKALDTIRSQHPLPVLPGTTDIYPWDISYLIASGNRWNPRPIFQSYSAYTGSLANINRAHLVGAGAPDNILFALKNIDNQFPNLQDGASWPLFWKHYAPVNVMNDFVQLRRQPEAREINRTLLFSGKVTMGQQHMLPMGKGLIYAKIRVRKSLIGDLVSLLYKVPQLEIKVGGGRSPKAREYRFVPGLASSGFLLSPVVTGVGQFIQTFVDGDTVSGNSVDWFSIDVAGRRMFWQPTFDVELWGIQLRPDREFHEATRQLVSEPSRITELATLPGACQGAVDALDGAAPEKQRSLPLGALVSVHGWLANSTASGQVPNEIVAILSPKFGMGYIVPTKPVSRPDVAQHFKRPALAKSGYQAWFSTRGIPPGDYEFAMGYRTEGGIRLCEPWRFPVTVGTPG